MAFVSAHQVAPCIVAHAWNADLSMVAVCPNNNEVHIYKASPESASEWDRAFVLKKHDQLVSGIDWAWSTNKLVTCSHDRNAYVWNFEGGEWQPALVILRLNRAAISARWSPKGNKFAVGSGAKHVCVCYYEEENNWWVSKLIKKKHSSTVTCVAWHPNNVLIATTSTDLKCRVFSAFVKGVDDRSESTTVFGEQSFGEMLLQIDTANGWAHGVAWSPCGSKLAFVSHDSTIHFVNSVGPDATAAPLPLSCLPLRDVLFLSERHVVAVGYDCNPALFVASEEGTWSFVRFIDTGKAPLSPTSASAFSEAFEKFHVTTTRGEGADALDSKARTFTHENTIESIRALRLSRDAQTVVQFSTSGLDGRVVVWNAAALTEGN